MPSNVSKRSVPVSPPAWRDSGVIFGWSEVPEPVPPTEHGYKYSAVYVVNGVRVVGFDNERGKGDHCHIEGKEKPYAFKSVEQLIEDFIAAVAARRAP